MSGKTILILVAGVIAAFVVISVKNHMSKPQEPAPVVAEASNRVVVAKRDLAPGSFIQIAQDLDWGVAPDAPTDGDNKESYLREGTVNVADFNGAVVRRQLHAGDAIPASALMKSGEGGFMSAVLEPGMRAVSIGVTATSGNAGFISPGDRVDLIVTHRVKAHSNATGAEYSGEESVVSETFVHNVRVVAVDQMLDNPENKAILAKTVTIEVSPRQAEQVAVAEEMGKISMALRSLTSPPAGAKNGVTELYDNYTRDSDVSSMLDQKGASVPRVHVIRGDQVQNLEFYQDMK